VDPDGGELAGAGAPLGCLALLADLRESRAALHPHSGLTRDASGDDGEARGGTDEGLLEGAQVPVEVLAVAAEVEDRVADKLTRAVVGDVAPALDLDAADAAARQLRPPGEEVLRAARPPEGHDRGVLAEEERVGRLTELPGTGEAPLESERVGVGDPPEVDGDDFPATTRRRLQAHPTEAVPESFAFRDPQLGRLSVRALRRKLHGSCSHD
jgi:hypothetical protein